MSIATALDEIQRRLLLLKTSKDIRRVEKKKRIDIDRENSNLVYKRDCPAVNIISGDVFLVDHQYSGQQMRYLTVVLRTYFWDRDDSVDIETEINDTIDKIVENIHAGGGTLTDLSGDDHCIVIKYTGDRKSQGIFEKLEIVEILFDMTVCYKVDGV